YTFAIWRRVGMSRGELPDVVMGSSPHLFGALAAERVARHLGVPFILEVRDLWPQSLIDLGGLPNNNPLVVVLALIERYLYRRADRIVTVLRTAVRHRGANGGRLEEVAGLPNGVDLGSVPEVKSVTPASGLFTVMYAGTHG